jgi:hypothetical protein
MTGVRVMRPTDVMLHVDELAHAQDYRPVELEDTAYNLSPVRSGSEARLEEFLNEAGGERKQPYMSLVRSLLAEGQRWDRTFLISPKQERVAFYVMGSHDGELRVPIFRISSPRLESTIARQLLYKIRDRALSDGRTLVKITDPHLGRETEKVIRDSGFVLHDGAWIGLVIRACADSVTVDELMSEAAESVNLTMPALRPHLSPGIAAELERTLWPAKITDSDLPTYLVPIRPRWSSDLFGLPRTLMPRQDSLGLSREHVYYRSPRPRVEQAPARLLWYVSGSRPGGIGAIVACSRLEEVACDKPSVLYSTYRHLGVWTRDRISEAAHDGQALALRFADTEIFPRQVSLRRLHALATENCQRLWLRSPSKVTTQFFAAVYREGQSDA